MVDSSAAVAALKDGDVQRALKLLTGVRAGDSDCRRDGEIAVVGAFTKLNLEIPKKRKMPTQRFDKQRERE